MSAELTPDDAVHAIQALTRVLQTIAQDLHAFTDRMERYAQRSERWMRWHFWLLGIILLSSAGMFVIGVRSHATQNDALRQVMQENRAIFQRLAP